MKKIITILLMVLSFNCVVHSQCSASTDGRGHINVVFRTPYYDFSYVELYAYKHKYMVASGAIPFNKFDVNDNGVYQGTYYFTDDFLVYTESDEYMENVHYVTPSVKCKVFNGVTLAQHKKDLKAIAQAKKDSIKAVRQDSIRAYRAYKRDSIAAEKQYVLDSIEQHKQYVADSLQAIEDLKQQRIQWVKDSIAEHERYIRDSIAEYETLVTNANNFCMVHHRCDTTDAVDYKVSVFTAYHDSVQQWMLKMEQAREDSIKRVEKTRRDSINAYWKRVQDSIEQERIERDRHRRAEEARLEMEEQARVRDSIHAYNSSLYHYIVDILDWYGTLSYGLGISVDGQRSNTGVRNFFVAELGVAESNFDVFGTLTYSNITTSRTTNVTYDYGWGYTTTSSYDNSITYNNLYIGGGVRYNSSMVLCGQEGAVSVGVDAGYALAGHTHNFFVGGEVRLLGWFGFKVSYLSDNTIDFSMTLNLIFK